MNGVEYRRLDVWMGPATAERKKSPFGAPHYRAEALLAHEALRLGGSAIVLLVCQASDIGPRGAVAPSLARVTFPGVEVVICADQGDLRFACDDCDCWRDNVRAIALTLERLRLAARYGVTKGNEQYQGFLALPGDAVPPRPRRQSGGMGLAASRRRRLPRMYVMIFHL